jgi:hypothetical protein
LSDKSDEDSSHGVSSDHLQKLAKRQIEDMIPKVNKNESSNVACSLDSYQDHLEISLKRQLNVLMQNKTNLAARYRI